MHLPRPLHPPQLDSRRPDIEPFDPSIPIDGRTRQLLRVPPRKQGADHKEGIPVLLQELPERVSFVASRATRQSHISAGVEYQSSPRNLFAPPASSHSNPGSGLGTRAGASQHLCRQGTVYTPRECGGSWLSRRSCVILGPPWPSLTDGGGMGWSLPTFQFHPNMQQVIQKGAKPQAITDEHSCPHNTTGLRLNKAVYELSMGWCLFQKSVREHCKLYAKIKSK